MADNNTAEAVRKERAAVKALLLNAENGLPGLSFPCKDEERLYFFFEEQRIMDTISELAGLLANVATFLGIPIAICLLRRENRIRREEKEIDAYIQLNSIYIDHLKTCLEYPQLAASSACAGDTEDERRQGIVLLITISMLECAYFLYRDQATEFRMRQWNGWNEYMRLMCQDKEVQRRWPAVILGFDTEFVAHMKLLYMEENDHGVK